MNRKLDALVFGLTCAVYGAMVTLYYTTHESYFAGIFGVMTPGLIVLWNVLTRERA